MDGWSSYLAQFLLLLFRFQWMFGQQYGLVVNGLTMSMAMKISGHLYDLEVKGQDQIFF